MSLYNLMHGTTQATFYILPMLGKHPDEYPRFRDCFLSDSEHEEYNNFIHIYTRTGGGNREGYLEENQEMRQMSGFVVDFDDSFDSTFASWVFKIPEQWKADFDLIVKGKILEISQEYKDQLKIVFPKLADQFDKLFTAETVE